MRAIEVVEDHMSSHSEVLQVIPASPVPGEPFEVLRIYKFQCINILVFSIFVHVSTLSTWALSVLVFCPLDLMNDRISDL